MIALGAVRCNSFSASPNLIASGRKYKSGDPVSNSIWTSTSVECDAFDETFNGTLNGIQSTIRTDLTFRDLPANQRCLGRYSGSSTVSRRRRPVSPKMLSHPAVTFNGGRSVIFSAASRLLSSLRLQREIATAVDKSNSRSEEFHVFERFPECNALHLDKFGESDSQDT